MPWKGGKGFWENWALKGQVGEKKEEYELYSSKIVPGHHAGLLTQVGLFTPCYNLWSNSFPPFSEGWDRDVKPWAQDCTAARGGTKSRPDMARARGPVLAASSVPGTVVPPSAPPPSFTPALGVGRGENLCAPSHVGWMNPAEWTQKTPRKPQKLTSSLQKVTVKA